MIIPVYNGLSHDLPKCLDSIWNQDIDQSILEVICVDDCSPDNTLAWLHQQEAAHPNLRVISHTRNKRQGGARNTGMKNAKGTFIAFIDQDDYYDNKAFMLVTDVLRHNPDLEILILDATYERPNNPNTKLQHNFSHRNILSGDDQIRHNGLPWAPWKFIFRRQLIIDHNLWFDENERIEDVDWVHRLVHFAKSTLYQPILFIHYIKNDTSTTMTSFKSKETMYSTIRCGMRLLALPDNEFKDSCNEVKQRLLNIGNSVISLGLRNYLFCRDSVKDKVKMISDIKNCNNSNHVSKISKVALKSPTLFSMGSNLTSFITPNLLLAYRKLKYSIKRNHF